MRRQVVVIHGGSPFDNYEDFLKSLSEKSVDLDYLKKTTWRKNLGASLGSDFDVIQLEMPNKMFAQYDVWKIWFEKYLPLFDKEVIFVGHSLGAVFLAKYLSENKIENTVIGLYLVAAPCTGATDESLGEFAVTPNKVITLHEKVPNTHFYHSTDDKVVPISELEMYRKLLPKAHFHIYADKEHFSIEEFPELIEDIKNAR